MDEFEEDCVLLLDLFVAKNAPAAAYQPSEEVVGRLTCFLACRIDQSCHGSAPIGRPSNL